MRDIAIEEIRTVRHRMSEESGHDLDRFFAMLEKEEKQFEPQFHRCREIERQYQQAATPCKIEAEGSMALRDKPKS